MNLTIAWLAQGKLRLKKPGEAPTTVESKFGQSIREKAVRAQQRHSWKNAGNDDNFLAGAMIWGRGAKDPASIPISITSICSGQNAGQMLYSLETNDFCAVLAVENLGAEERRIWNKNDKRLGTLCVGQDGSVACSMRHQHGTANIAVRLDDESGFSEVTEGDSVDAAPRWVPGPDRRLVFQSAGVGRSREGHFAGIGPFAVQYLDVETGDMKTLAEETGTDFLTPQMTADGTLYYIRRPYSNGREINPLRALLDVILFPFRLLYAFFQFFQFFSIRYTGKKLTSAGGARSRQMDLKQMTIWGNMVSAARHSNIDDDAPDMVPNTWQLMRQREGAAPETIAKGVLSYDLAPDGSIVYSNGNAIFVLKPNGEKERLCTEALIEQVVVLNAPPA